MALPKGVVRVYKADKGGDKQFVGEDSIDHTPRDTNSASRWARPSRRRAIASSCPGRLSAPALGERVRSRQQPQGFVVEVGTWSQPAASGRCLGTSPHVKKDGHVQLARGEGARPRGDESLSRACEVVLTLTESLVTAARGHRPPRRPRRARSRPTERETAWAFPPGRSWAPGQAPAEPPEEPELACVLRAGASRRRARGSPRGVARCPGVCSPCAAYRRNDREGSALGRALRRRGVGA
jgi:hypothetical protein